MADLYIDFTRKINLFSVDRAALNGLKMNFSEDRLILTAKFNREFFSFFNEFILIDASVFFFRNDRSSKNKR